jgi:hypothetical protein
MTMKFTQIITHFSADEALEIIAFLDQLKNTLWINYREEIEELQREGPNDHTDDKQQHSDTNDPIQF